MLPSQTSSAFFNVASNLTLVSSIVSCRPQRSPNTIHTDLHKSETSPGSEAVFCIIHLQRPGSERRRSERPSAKDRGESRRDATHLAEAPRCGPHEFSAASRSRATGVAGSEISSVSDSDTESKPEAKNSSTVNSARRLRITVMGGAHSFLLARRSPLHEKSKETPSGYGDAPKDRAALEPTYLLRPRAAAMTTRAQRVSQFRSQNAERSWHFLKTSAASSPPPHQLALRFLSRGASGVQAGGQFPTLGSLGGISQLQHVFARKGSDSLSQLSKTQ